MIDDNFASTVSKWTLLIPHNRVLMSIVEGVAEGRLIFANLKRSIQYASRI